MCFVLTFSIENVNNLNKKKSRIYSWKSETNIPSSDEEQKKRNCGKKKPFNEHLLNVFNVKKTETK